MLLFWFSIIMILNLYDLYNNSVKSESASLRVSLSVCVSVLAGNWWRVLIGRAPTNQDAKLVRTLRNQANPLMRLIVPGTRAYQF